jgi:hypothetical protein
MIIWSFAVVSEASLEKEQVQSFIEKLVYITEPNRGSSEWREGPMLCAQTSFAPILLNKMEQVDYQGRLAMVNEQINSTKEILHQNIDLALKRDETLDDMNQKSEELSVMAKQFKKRAKQVKRFKMVQNAKHGIIIGTAVTGCAAAIIVPPIVALL